MEVPGGVGQAQEGGCQRSEAAHNIAASRSPLLVASHRIPHGARPPRPRWPPPSFYLRWGATGFLVSALDYIHDLISHATTLGSLTNSK